MYKRGQCGNPRGRPKKEASLTETLREYLGKLEVEYNGERISGTKAIALKVVQLALGGDVACLKYIWDRVDGPIQPVVQAEADQVIIIGAPKPSIPSIDKL